MGAEADEEEEDSLPFAFAVHHRRIWLSCTHSLLAWQANKM